jgi:hypothetical protein
MRCFLRIGQLSPVLPVAPAGCVSGCLASVRPLWATVRPGATRASEVVSPPRLASAGPPIFLISLKAGGSGLNLTEADYCFLLDPWWNPATEAQAIDRTHRIGQTRNVMVYRLIARDTIEQKVMALKARKAELFASVIDDGNVFGGSLDADDIRGLLA